MLISYHKMRKGFTVILVAVVILSIVSFLPVNQKSTIGISANFDNTLLQVIHIENWKNWYPGMKEAFQNMPANCSLEKDTSKKVYTISTPGKKYIIHAITPMSYQVIEEGDTSKNIFAFTVFPGDAAGSMKIFIEKKTPLLFSIFSRNYAAEDAINGLKSYLEDPKSFYGFKIEMSEIRDSVIASSVFKIKRKGLFLKIQDACKELTQYIKTNSLIKTGHTSISYIPLSDDSLRLTVGIPVNRPGPPEKEIHCLSLPAKGRVLIGNYEGKFSDRQKIYFAMSKYLTDHTLSVPAESFERYLNDSIPTSDSSVIRIELNYPVY